MNRSRTGSQTGSRNWREWVIPPAVSAWAARRNWGGGGAAIFDNSVGSWSAAVSQSSGYDCGLILEKVRGSTQSVLSGEAAFERDGVTFANPEYRWPVLAGLLQVAASEGELRVLDFGGSLGSVFWQHRNFLTGFPVAWGVVEQPEFVAAGKSLQQEAVNFFDSVAQCRDALTPNVVLISSVLQYLPDPQAVITEILACGANTIIIDRTPMSDHGSNIACIQKVPEHIYRASYPAWIFSRSWLTSQISGWTIAAEFEGIEPVGVTTSGVRFSWDGLIAKRNPHA